MKQWQQWSEKFLEITTREQYLILLTGLAAVFFILFSFFIEANLITHDKNKTQIRQLKRSLVSQQDIVSTYQQALQKDPNEKVRKQISKYENELIAIDGQLLSFTSNLISPVQMRFALMDLLKLQKGVSLQAFHLSGAAPLLPTNSIQVEKVVTPVVDSEKELTLYRHGIKLTLSGNYFQLRDYLTQLESLSWKFFWQNFHYQVQEYPVGQLDIEIYSLSTQQEFIGV